MKKTLVAFFALSCVAGAANVGDTVTLGSYYNTGSGDILAVDAISGNSSLPGLTLGNLTLNPGKNGGSDTGLTFVVTVSDLLTTTSVSSDDVLRLDAFTLMSRNNGQYTGDDRYITVQVNGEGTVYRSGGMVRTQTTGYGHETMTFTGDNAPEFSLSDTLTVRIYSDSADGKFGFGGMAAPNSDTTVVSGTDYEIAAGGLQYKHALKLDATFMTPEPATATLSLLALAGLAARRRRH